METKSKRFGVSDTNLRLDKKTLEFLNKSSDSMLFLDLQGNILGLKEKIWDRYPYMSVIKAYEEIKKGKGRISGEFEDNGQTLKFRARRSGEFIFFEFEDITSFRHLEDFKKKIVSTVSHELRTPLTIAKGYVELLSLEYESELTDKVIKQLDKIIGIVNSISLLMKGKAVNLESVELKPLIEETKEHFKGKFLVKNLEFIDETDRDFTVLAEKILLRQMLLNLIDNAVKFTENGTVGIKAYTGEKEKIVEVFDTGAGIPEDLKPFIFDKFVKAKESPGLGIGLSLVKTIVKHHGWKIEFESAAGEGTKFVIKIPIKN